MSPQTEGPSGFRLGQEADHLGGEVLGSVGNEEIDLIGQVEPLDGDAGSHHREAPGQGLCDLPLDARPVAKGGDDDGGIVVQGVELRDEADDLDPEELVEAVDLAGRVGPGDGEGGVGHRGSHGWPHLLREPSDPVDVGGVAEVADEEDPMVALTNRPRLGPGDGGHDGVVLDDPGDAPVLLELGARGEDPDVGRLVHGELPPLALFDPGNGAVAHVPPPLFAEEVQVHRVHRDERPGLP